MICIVYSHVHMEFENRTKMECLKSEHCELIEVTWNILQGFYQLSIEENVIDPLYWD